MMKLKECPRCQGDMHVDKAYDGTYIACLQCGYRTYPDFTPEPIVTTRRRRRRKVNLPMPVLKPEY